MGWAGVERRKGKAREEMKKVLKYTRTKQLRVTHSATSFIDLQHTINLDEWFTYANS